MNYQHKKNSNKVTLKLPLSDGISLIEFEISFDKGKKKSEKGLYKLRFNVGEENRDKLTINDVDFLCQGFIHLITQLADQAGNPLYSVAQTL